jgi:hypothetical protein
MDLAAAQGLLKGENARWFQRTCAEADKPVDTSLEEYLEEISADPESWVRSLPAKAKARSTLIKPKTAVLALLALAEVAIDAEVKEDVRSKLEGVYRNKAFIDSVLKDRAPAVVTAEGEAEPVDTDTNAAKVVLLREQVEMLKRVVKACCANTDFADTVAILVDGMPDVA